MPFTLTTRYGTKYFCKIPTCPYFGILTNQPCGSHHLMELRHPFGGLRGLTLKGLGSFLLGELSTLHSLIRSLIRSTGVFALGMRFFPHNRMDGGYEMCSLCPYRCANDWRRLDLVTFEEWWLHGTVVLLQYFGEAWWSSTSHIMELESNGEWVLKVDLEPKTSFEG